MIASFILFIFTNLLSPDLKQNSKLQQDINFGVIVDCGSSGSRAHIFKWKTNQKAIGIELLRDKTDGKPISKHITPGLSSIKDEPNRASQYMKPIMDFIDNSIPQDRHLDTPVYFMATAGLRLLEVPIQKKILTAITRDIRAKYDFPKVKSQIISGEYEGVYSWLSLNRHRLYNDSKKPRSLGMIEMGGASVQVTFELNPEVENSILKNLQNTDAIMSFKNEQTTVRLNRDNTVKLFAATFLGLGVNSARESAIDLLIRDHLNGLDSLHSVKTNLNQLESLKDPCLTSGSSETVQRPLELLNSKHQPIGLTVQNGEKTFKLKLEGTGNFIHCLNLLDRVLQIVKEEKLNCQPGRQSCPMSLLGSDFIPYTHYSFVGLSEMFFTTNEMLNSAGRFNRSRIMQETQRVCETPYNRLLEMYSGDAVSFQDRILYECFKASWLLNLIHLYGFRMPEDYNDFRTVNQLDGQEIDWTIGAILTEVVLRDQLETKS